MIGYRQLWNGNADDYTDVIVDTTSKTMVPAFHITSVSSLDKQTFIAGVLVGMIGLLIVIGLVAAILILRQRAETNAEYRRGGNPVQQPSVEDDEYAEYGKYQDDDYTEYGKYGRYAEYGK